MYDFVWSYFPLSKEFIGYYRFWKPIYRPHKKFSILHMDLFRCFSLVEAAWKELVRLHIENDKGDGNFSIFPSCPPIRKLNISVNTSSGIESTASV
jgi:hypothetical protein